MNTHLLNKAKKRQKDPCAYPERKKILLIDDDKWIRLFFKSFSNEEDCCLITLETAEQGLKKLEEQEFDIIAVDQDLLGMSGLEFLVRIQESHPHAIRILIIEPQDRDLVSFAKNSGIQGFMEKSNIKLPLYFFN